MINREQIITNMCMTFRHDYGLEISEDDRMYTLMSGMTKREREALFNSMAQIFDNDIAPLIETATRYESGTHIFLIPRILNRQEEWFLLRKTI